MKKVSIVVKDGLVQEVYAEDCDVEVVIHDLDTNDPDELSLVIREVLTLPYIAKKVY